MSEDREESGRQDQSRKKRKTARAAASFIVTGVLLVLLIVVSVNIGSLKVSPSELFRGLFIKRIDDVAAKSLTTTSSGGLLLPLQRGIVTAHPTGWCRKHFYWSAYKAVLLESSFLDSSACSLIYFCTASSVILPIVST